MSATITSLREEGFAGTSARSIARHGRFNQALIFYHYGSVLDAMVAALERVSAERLDQYRDAVDTANDLSQALAVAQKQYAVDVKEGHITVLAELVAGASSVPELGPEMVRCLEPWTRFAQETIRRLIAGTALDTVIPPAQAARAIVAVYLGMELLDHLDPAAKAADDLFEVARQLVRAARPLLATGRAKSEAADTRLRRVDITTS
ncbi:MAG: TetR/AcrR family transcriptional regulator [Candidatus Dormibacteria bacterium]